ncbi:SMI1/KNR4 family protein [Undibacterium pigrum]|uniref:SMI1/KNR4 family protein SUKH-1 n=1 Tax=Undibacterium pigrum TaxID=401470 RepID=A0A318JEJ6_9BURK|nr:SMI1/KNR4 family protein [Undibacterium pigrum]PXX42089.1 SMI1/KNR4 family protein SUKH-1 [Undibacterium pigrum]
MAFTLDEKFIELAEAELGIRFPDSFRNRMMQRNGGSIEIFEDVFDLHPFYDTTDKRRLKSSCNSIVHETQTARQHYGLPDDLILIARNGGGDSLCFQILKNGELDQHVYLHRHDVDELQPVAAEFSAMPVTT